MSTATAQINVRLDAGLKQSGDAALTASGFTPSQAVRSLWELASSLSDRPGALADILQPDRAQNERRERERAAKKKLKLIEEGSGLFATACDEVGIDAARGVAMSDDALKRAAFAERFGDEMGWLYE